MSFDADAYLEAREPWSLTLGGITYRARWISVEEVQDFLARLGAAGKAPKAGRPAAQRAALRWFLRRCFPWRPSFWWREDPVRRILALDVEAQQVILANFFVWRAGTMTPRTSRTPGTGTPNRSSPPKPASDAA